jgi:SAM-dependent methyltransferase
MNGSSVDKLLKYIQQVCATVLGEEASMRISISAIESGDDDFPAGITATHEYMVFLDFSEALDLMIKALKGLSSFVGKNVRSYEHDMVHCLYWGEGEPLEEMLSSMSLTDHHDFAPQKSNQSPFQAVQWLKTDTVLPEWLDRLLFDTLGARYAPDWEKFEYNLELDADDIKVYLGTYFPRSYIEAFCILDDLFATSAYNAVWKDKTEARILDLGCGTGGNLIGLLTALLKHCPHLHSVHIHAFDGNARSLEAAEAIARVFASKVPCAVNADFSVMRISELDDFPRPVAAAYDFITSFKMGGEIISRNAGLADEFYHRFLALYAPFLSDIGLIILLDVTTRPKHSNNFYPMLLNSQTSQFVREQPTLTTIVPVPCHLYESNCEELCFTQKEFSVSHRARRNDLSRVTYRVLAQGAFASVFHEHIERDAEYIIGNRAKPKTVSPCPHSSGQGLRLDGYRIS